MVEFCCEAIRSCAFVCWKISDYSLDFLVCDASLPLLSVFLSFIFCPTSFGRDWAAFLGCLVFSTSVKKLSCGSCSAFRWSFDEFVGEKLVSTSYSSAILGLPSAFPSFETSCMLWNWVTYLERQFIWSQNNIRLKRWGLLIGDWWFIISPKDLIHYPPNLISSVLK